jgi:hypothetical protein
MSERRELPGIEIFRTDDLKEYSISFRRAATICATLGFIPVVQVEDKDIVLYAVSSGAIRKAKVSLQKSVAND